MSHILSATPVRSNLASMLLQLKELPPDVVNDGLNRFVMLEQTPPFLKADSSFNACSSTADVTTFATSAFSFATGTRMAPVESRTGTLSSSSSIINPPGAVVDVTGKHRNSRGVPGDDPDLTATDETCNCRKSRCLKLYCQCFAAKIFCSPTCNCEACANNPENNETRLEAIRVILERNASAFDAKIKPTASAAGASALSSSSALNPAAGALGSVQGIVVGGAHKIGCRCRKSMCLKKYCECFQGAVQCTAMCTCLHCKNTGENAGAALLRAAETKVATSTSAAAVAAFTGVGGRPLRKPLITGSTSDGLEDHSLIQAAIDLAHMTSSNDTSKKVRNWSPDASSGDESIGNTSGSSGGYTIDMGASDTTALLSAEGVSERAGVSTTNRKSGSSGAGSGGRNDISSTTSPYKRKREFQMRELRIDGQLDCKAMNSTLWEPEDSFVMITKSPRTHGPKGNDAMNSLSSRTRNITRPSILSRAKFCPAIPNKHTESSEYLAFDEGATNGFDTPSTHSRGLHTADALLSTTTRRAESIRSASPNTLNVATALSLLCGLGGTASPTHAVVDYSCRDAESSDHPKGTRKPTQSPTAVDNSRVSSGIASLIRAESSDAGASECDYDKSLFSSSLLASSQMLASLPPLPGVSKSSDTSEFCNYSSSKSCSSTRRPHAGSLDATSEEELSVASPVIPSSNDSTFTTYSKRAPIVMIIDPLHVAEDL